MSAPKIREEVRITPDGRSNAWIVVMAKAGREREVRDRLKAQGFEVYVPLRLLPMLQAKRRGVTSVPLFPRIVFARATLDAKRWQVIFSTLGVQRVLCDPMKPRGLRPEFIQRLQRREIDGYLRIGLHDPSQPKAAPVPKDHRRWVKLDDVVAGLLDEAVDVQRESLLISLIDEGRAAISQGIPRL